MHNQQEDKKTSESTKTFKKVKYPKCKRYTHQSAYKEYAKSVEYPLDFKTYDKFIRLLMYKLNIKIIKEKYEWKLPNAGGYIRISRDRKGIFFWYWDRSNTYCRLKKKRLWSFKPVSGWFQDYMIGDKGLRRYYTECKQNPKVENYDVPIIRHQKIK